MSEAEERSVMLDELFERLPSWLELVDASGLAPTLRDRRDGMTWRLFPGQRFVLGATGEKLAALDAMIARNPVMMNPAQRHLPTRELTIAPFVMRERVVCEGDDEKFFVTHWEKQARDELSVFEARLPWEAEWELAWSVVQREPRGWVPSSYELCEDQWSVDRLELEEEPFVRGGPGVVRTGSFDRAQVDWFLPERLPLKIERLASVRPTLSCSR
ncbi:MAG: hypothetical protein QM817_10670 [Archangium sp.]